MGEDLNAKWQRWTLFQRLAYLGLMFAALYGVRVVAERLL